METVCFFSGDITRGGGTERVAVTIANELAAEGRYRILFLSLVEQKEQPFFEIDNRIERHALGDRWLQPGPGYLKLLPRLKRFLREQKVDVLIDIDIVLDALAIPMARSAGTKVISWEHFNYYYELDTFYRKEIMKYSAKRADHCVLINAETYRCYQEHLHRKQKISLIYNPMEAPGMQSVQREKWILWVGSLVDRKGPEYLAETASRVLADHPDWKWIVLGEGDRRPFLEEFIQKNNLQDRLILKGAVTNVGDYYARAMIYVMTSRAEGLPMCLLEAKSYGLPCVSFDILTGPGEIIRDDVNGYLIPPYDCDMMAAKISALMDDPVLHADFMERTGLDREKFELQSVMRSWNEVIESLCS